MELDVTRVSAILPKLASATDGLFESLQYLELSPYERQECQLISYALLDMEQYEMSKSDRNCVLDWITVLSVRVLLRPTDDQAFPLPTSYQAFLQPTYEQAIEVLEQFPMRVTAESRRRITHSGWKKRVTEAKKVTAQLPMLESSIDRLKREASNQRNFSKARSYENYLGQLERNQTRKVRRMFMEAIKEANPSFTQTQLEEIEEKLKNS